jgi:HNH endonuclease
MPPYVYPFRTAEQSLILAVWNKGAVVSGYDPGMHRKDMCGAWMQFDQHGKEGDYGWEIDHIKPKALRGSDDLSNLQPLWWQNNRRKSDTYPWSCS